MKERKKHIDGFYTAELGVLCRWLLFLFFTVVIVLHHGYCFFCFMETFKIIIIIILNDVYTYVHMRALPLETRR